MHALVPTILGLFATAPLSVSPNGQSSGSGSGESGDQSGEESGSGNGDGDSGIRLQDSSNINLPGTFLYRLDQQNIMEPPGWKI